MAKVNNRKSDSWRPSMVANGGGMISKNQKRKEKRLSQGLGAFKSQETPSKKSMLGPLNKLKENLNQSLNLSSLGKKKENKLLSTSLPIKGHKKFASETPQKKNAKPSCILSNSNTPKSKGNHVTFNVAEKDDKFILSEAEEGEEPVTDKVVKPYEKGSQQRKQKRKMSMMNVEDSDDEGSDSDDGLAGNFVDMEASEGEETDDSDSLDEEESIDEGSEDDFMTDNSDEEDDFDEEDDENSEEDSDSEQESEDDIEMANISKAVATPNRRESVIAMSVKKKKAESTPVPKKIAVKTEAVTPQLQKTNKVEPESKKVNVKVEPESKKVNIKAELDTRSKPVKTSLAKEKAQQATVEKKEQSKKKVKKDGVEGAEKKVEEEGEEKITSPYVGIIRRIHKNISVEDVKAALTKKINPQNIIGIRLRNGGNALVYLKDEISLNELLNNAFSINENYKFVVYKARVSNSDKPNKPEKFVAFLPRVPLTVTLDSLNDALVKDIGADGVEKVKFKKVYKHLQTRNILVYFNNLESLQKMVQKGECKVGPNLIIVRTAFETSAQIPTFKVLLTSVPEKIAEATLKKAIESKIGRDTVLSVRYSQKKPSFAFVALKSEEAKKKVLEVGNNITVNGKKVEVNEFKPRTPTKKRAAPSEAAKEKKKNKAKKRKLEDGTASVAPKSGEKNKGAVAAQQNGDAASPKANVKKQPQAPSKGADVQKNAKKGAQSSPGQEVAAKVQRKKNKQFPKPGKGVTPKQEPQSPTKVSAPGKGANQKQQPKSAVKPGKDAANPKPKPQGPVKVSVNGTSPSSPKQQQKKKKQPQLQQQSPKPVDAKKKALSQKIESKLKNKQNSLKRDA